MDDESLELVAKDFQVPVEQVKKTMKTPHLLKKYREETFRNDFKKLVSTFGRLLAVGLYFPAIYYLQLHILDTVTEDAKVLLRWKYSKPRSNSTYP